MTQPSFRLTDPTVAALTAAVMALSADLDQLRGQFEQQPTEWRYSPRGTEVATWLDRVEDLCAVMEEVERAAPDDQQTPNEPPATDAVAGGSFWGERERGRNGPGPNGNGAS